MPVPQSQAGIISRCEFEMNQREMTNQVSCGSVSGRVRFYSGLTRWLRFRVLVVIFVHQNGLTKRTVRVCLWGNMRKVAPALMKAISPGPASFFLQIPRGLCSVLCPASLSSDIPFMLSSYSLSEGLQSLQEPRLSGKHFHWLLCWVLPTVMQSAAPVPPNQPKGCKTADLHWMVNISLSQLSKQ